MSTSAHFRPMIVLMLAGAAGCSVGGGRPEAAIRAPVAPASIIAENEIANGPGRTAYETIQQLRPHFLSTMRAQGTSGERLVYVDGARIGGLDALHTVRSTSVREIRFLDAREATIRFGSGHSVGALLIATKTGR